MRATQRGLRRAADLGEKCDRLIGLRRLPEGTVCRPDRGPFSAAARALRGPAAPSSFTRPAAPLDR